MLSNKERLGLQMHRLLHLPLLPLSQKIEPVPGDQLSTITATDLASALTGNPDTLDVHLKLVERDVLIDGHLVKIHCHCLTVDGNGLVQPRRLAEFMRHAAVNYAIPRSKLLEAKERDLKYNSVEAISALVEGAKRTFTDLAKTGEGGELLLFLLAERFLKRMRPGNTY